MDELAERIMELEIRYAYQNRLLEEFNQLLIESARRLDNLERENRGMREMLQGMMTTPEESPDE